MIVYAPSEGYTPYIAFDPGDRWTGLAVMGQCQRDPRCWFAEAAILDQQRRPRFIAAKYLRHYLSQSRRDVAHVVAERYQVRAEGHQRWNQGETLKLLGALEYEALHWGATWSTEPPGDPEQLRHLPLWNLVHPWSRYWDVHAAWQHTRSAWRVLAMYLLRTRPQVLDAVERLRRPSTMDASPFGRFKGLSARDGVAPTLYWEMSV